MNKTLITKLRSFGRRLLREESGQSIVEYVLVLFIVVMIASKVKSSIMTKVTGLVDNTGNRLDSFADEE